MAEKILIDDDLRAHRDEILLALDYTSDTVLSTELENTKKQTSTMPDVSNTRSSRLPLSTNEHDLLPSKNVKLFRKRSEKRKKYWLETSHQHQTVNQMNNDLIQISLLTRMITYDQFPHLLANFFDNKDIQSSRHLWSTYADANAIFQISKFSNKGEYNSYDLNSFLVELDNIYKFIPVGKLVVKKVASTILEDNNCTVIGNRSDLVASVSLNDMKFFSINRGDMKSIVDMMDTTKFSKDEIEGIQRLEEILQHNDVKIEIFQKIYGKIIIDNVTKRIIYFSSTGKNMTFHVSNTILPNVMKPPRSTNVQVMNDQNNINNDGSFGSSNDEIVVATTTTGLREGEEETSNQHHLLPVSPADNFMSIMRKFGIVHTFGIPFRRKKNY